MRSLVNSSVSCQVAFLSSIWPIHDWDHSLTACHGNVAASWATSVTWVIAACASDVGSSVVATILRKPQVNSGKERSLLEYLSFASLRKSGGRNRYGSRESPLTGNFLPVGFPSGGYWSSSALSAACRAVCAGDDGLDERREECLRRSLDLDLVDCRCVDRRREEERRSPDRGRRDDERLLRLRLRVYPRSGVILRLALDRLLDEDLERELRSALLSILSILAVSSLMREVTDGSAWLGLSPAVLAGITFVFGGAVRSIGIGSVCVLTPAMTSALGSLVVELAPALVTPCDWSDDSAWLSCCPEGMSWTPVDPVSLRFAIALAVLTGFTCWLCLRIIHGFPVLRGFIQFRRPNTR